MKQKSKTVTGFKGAKNIGPTIAKRLTEIGVYSLADLQQMGASKAYVRIKENYPGKTIPVCYYLYSFEGALLNVHWNDIPEKRKKELLRTVRK
ncbi:MAG: TfoX/Sxy family protein [Bacteroidota bacterium]